MAGSSPVGPVLISDPGCWARAREVGLTFECMVRRALGLRPSFGPDLVLGLGSPAVINNKK